MTSLDLFADPVDLTAALVDIESPSHHEEAIADAIEDALSRLEHAQVQRFGNTVVARTDFGLGSRVVLAGHIDTVPLADNTPHRLVDGILYGCGSVDMKSGMACYLNAFAQLAAPGKAAHDLTLILSLIHI